MDSNHQPDLHPCLLFFSQVLSGITAPRIIKRFRATIALLIVFEQETRLELVTLCVENRRSTK